MTNLRPTIALRGWSNVIQIKSNMAAGRHLEKIDMTSQLRQELFDFDEVW